jgi:hypothetical protein
MADNVAVTEGSGKTIASDEITGVNYQRIKLIHGAEGVNDGDVATANPLPVAQTGPLPAGTNAIGKLAANSGVDIGDVDVTSSALPTGAATSAKQDTGNTSLGNLDTKVGEVQASPTANTVLGRLKDLLTGIVLAAGANIIGKVGIDQTTPGTTNKVSLGSDTVKTDGSAVTQPVSAASLPLPTGAATSAKQDTGNTSVASVDTKLGEVQASPTANTVLGRLKDLLTGIVLSAGSAIIGKVGIDQTTDGTTNKVSLGTDTVKTSIPAATSGGASIFRSIDLDESEEEVKGSAGQLYGGVVINLATGVRYLKFYNATAANVTVGTTTPVMTIPIPTAGSANGAGFVIPIPSQGVPFDTAITVAATTGIADNDTGAPGANECIVNLFFK